MTTTTFAIFVFSLAQSLWALDCYDYTIIGGYKLENRMDTCSPGKKVEFWTNSINGPLTGL